MALNSSHFILIFRGFCGSGIWEGLSGAVLAQGLTWLSSHGVVAGAGTKVLKVGTSWTSFSLQAVSGLSMWSLHWDCTELLHMMVASEQSDYLLGS